MKLFIGFLLFFFFFLDFGLAKELSFQNGEILEINSKQLYGLLNDGVSDLLVLVYQEDDLLTPNVLRNFTKAAQILENTTKPGLKYAKVTSKPNSKLQKKLQLTTFPSVIFITPNNFYQLTPITPESLSSSISTDQYKSTPSYTIPKSLSIPQILLKVLQEGLQGHLTIILNLFFMLCILTGLVFFIIYNCINKAPKPKVT